MNVLIACEESQRVCIEFRKRGFNAFSCDIQECSGEHPEWHIISDVLPLLNGHCEFITQYGLCVRIDEKWDLIIAHPPCTDLCVSGARWFKEKQADGRQQKSIDFFMKFTNIQCDHVAIENPVGIMSTHYRKPNQIIQPYQFGHPYTKSTCLWLKNLPLLIPTDILEKPEKGWINQSFTHDGRYGGFKNFNGSKERSKTFLGIAKAMAEQWGNCLINGRDKHI